MSPLNIVRTVLLEVCDALRADEALREAGVEVVDANGPDFAQLVRRGLAQLSAPVAVVALDGAKGLHPASELTLSVSVVEQTVLNRTGAGPFLTALDVALESVRVLDGEAIRFFDMRNDPVDETGVWQCTAIFKTAVITAE